VRWSFFDTTFAPHTTDLLLNMFSDHQHIIKKWWQQILTHKSLIKICNKTGAWMELCNTPETIQNGEENFCNIQTDILGYVTAKKCNILITVQNHQFT